MAESMDAELAAAAAREASLAQRLETAMAREAEARQEVASELRARLQAQVRATAIPATAAARASDRPEQPESPTREAAGNAGGRPRKESERDAATARRQTGLRSGGVVKRVIVAASVAPSSAAAVSFGVVA